MRILSVIHQFYPTSQGGAETYAYHLGLSLQALGHEVHVFHRENQAPRWFRRGEGLHEEDINVDGLPVHRVYMNRSRTLNRGALFRFFTTFYNPPIERAFARYLDEFEPDLVHLHHLLYLSGGLIGIARKRGIAVVGTLHDYWYFCPNAQLLRPNGRICDKNPGKIYCAACMNALYRGRIPGFLLPLGGPFFTWQQQYLRRALSRANLLIAPSRFLLERYVQAGYPRKSLVYLENSSPETESTPAKRRRPPDYPIRVGYIGSLARHKGVHILIQSFREISPDLATLYVYGSPDAFPDYSGWLAELATGRPNVLLQGAFEHGRIEEVLAGLDLIVVPSLWYENCPMVIQEAFRAGIPAVASRIGALPEKVQEGDYGVRFEPGDAEDLRRVLLQVLQNPNELRRFRRNLQGYDNGMNAHLQTLLGLYRSVTDGPREPSAS